MCVSSSLDLNEPPHIKEEEEEELWPPQQEETPQTAEHNGVKFLLFQTGSVKNEQHNDHVNPSLTKLPCEDLEDSELDPQPGTSVQQTCSDEDAPEATDPDPAPGNGQLDCMELEAPLSEVVDSYICTICGRAFAQRGHWAKHVQVHRKVETKVD